MQVQQLSLFDQVESQSKVKSTSSDIAKALKLAYESGWPDEFGRLLNSWSKQTVPHSIRTLSLFSGGGGLDVGFHDAGFDILAMVEIEEKFANTLRANCGLGKYFNEAKTIHGDVRNFDPPDDLHIDFIIGGPPCQTFSAAGRRAAGVQGIDDDRGMLFTEYIRLVKHLSPKGFLFENVYGITGAQNGDSWVEIRKAFAEAGYKIFYRVLDAADYGVPQHRERLFIVGIKKGEYFFPKPTHGPDSPDHFPYYTAGKAVSSLEIAIEDREKIVGGRFGSLLVDIPPGLNYSFYTENMRHPKPVFAWRSKFSDFLYKADPDTPVRTIKAQGGQYTGPFHWENRPFSIGELKRLQTIPDKYKVVGGRQVAIQQIGNSVPPQIARILALSILTQIFDVQLPFELPLLAHTEELGFRQRKRQLTQIYQAKAQTAISQLKEQATITAIPHQYRAKLTDAFGWQELTDKSNNREGFYVQFDPNRREWRFFVTDDPQVDKQKFAILVRPTGQGWGLNVERVALIGGTLSFAVFTGLWKAFDRQLALMHIKADLVQLCGYYQYQPNFCCSMSFEDDKLPIDWQVIQKVVQGVGVRRILPESLLGQLWNLPETAVYEVANSLKSIGYEVRNKNTNSQIPEKHFLIPYQFPTLTPVSVQLRKSLEI
jgi:DNA (cytosine-5)-methyltransferase 1